MKTYHRVLIPFFNSEAMADATEEIPYPPDTKQLYRSFSFEVESRISPDAPSDQLARLVVEDVKKEDQREREMFEARKYFEPWSISE